MTEHRAILSESGDPFATGAADYFDAHPGWRDPHARIYVQFQPEGSPFEFLALLDTGAHYCILNSEAARLTRDHLGESLDRVEIRTSHGLVDGDLYQHRIRLLAEVGEPLELESIVFVPSEWRAPCFLGYTGVLDRMRFAISPRNNRFFFGPPD